MPAALFVGLNVLDAYLTKTALSIGAVEFNPVMTMIGSNILIKGGIAVVLAFLLYYFHQRRALWILNIAFFGIVLWNLAMCFIMDSIPTDYAMPFLSFFG
jgi:hypothetical protein